MVAVKTQKRALSQLNMSLVLPGDSIPVPSTSTLKLGPGLLQPPRSNSRQVIATKAGLLNHTANGTAFWVESNSRRVWLYILKNR